MSSAHAGRSNAAAVMSNLGGGGNAAGSVASSSTSARNRKRKPQPASMNAGKGNRPPQGQQLGGPGLPFQQHPGNFQGGPRGPGFPGQMPPPGMHPHMMPSTGMGFGLAEEEDPIDYIIDDTSKLTSRDIAMARYKRNHELLNMVFDARRIDALVPPPSPYASMDKAALQERVASLKEETCALKRAHEDQIAQWQQEANEHEDMLHAPPKRLKQQREAEDAMKRAAIRGEEVDGNKDTETPVWAQAPFYGRILGVGYVRAVTPDEVRAQLPPTPPSHSPSPPPRPQQVPPTPQQPQQPVPQPQASQQGTAAQAGQQAPTEVKQEAASSSQDITAPGEQSQGAAPLADAPKEEMPSQSLEAPAATMESVGALADNRVPGLDDDADGDGEEDDEDDMDAESDDEDADAEGEEDVDDATGAKGEEDAADEHAENAANDEGGVHNEYGNAKEEDHVIAMGIADAGSTQEDADLKDFVAAADQDAMTAPLAAEPAKEDGSAAVQAALGDVVDLPAEAQQEAVVPEVGAAAFEGDVSMQDAAGALGAMAVPAEEAGEQALAAEDTTVPAPITEATVPTGSGLGETEAQL